MALSGLRIPGREILEAAFERYAGTKMGFFDAYNTELMRKRRIIRIFSYDTDFDGVSGVERVEP